MDEPRVLRLGRGVLVFSDEASEEERNAAIAAMHQEIRLRQMARKVAFFTGVMTCLAGATVLSRPVGAFVVVAGLVLWVIDFVVLR